MAAQDFWNSTPERNPDVASLEAFGGSIYWGGPRLFHLDAWQAVLFDALDGTTPLLDLAEDVTAALDISSAAAYQILESLVRDLAAAAAVSGVPDPPKAVKHESSPEPSTSSDEAAFPAPGPGVIRTVTQEAGGNTVVTDLHPDGSRRRPWWRTGRPVSRRADAARLVSRQQAPAWFTGEQPRSGDRWEASRH